MRRATLLDREYSFMRRHEDKLDVAIHDNFYASFLRDVIDQESVRD